jgi:SAM-dependent methyltransferase
VQTYGPGFAQLYNTRWTGFARQVAPPLLAFYAATPEGQARATVLDLCCGTGQLALSFLQAGYPVIGLDLSPAMLRLAAENAAAYTASEQARFVLRDASDFTLPQPVGFAMSTYDALNHLPDLAALARCFACVSRALTPGGWFVFDLNTHVGLRDRWNSIQVEDGPEVVLIQRSLFPVERPDRGWSKFSGFVRQPDGHYTRFDETVYNTAFPLADVLAALTAAGFSRAHAARLTDLATPLPDPEAEGRVFLVAQRAA